MASLIMYGILALVAIGALVGVNAALKSHYVAPERAKWDKEKAVLVGDKNTCVAANKSLDEQFATFRNVHNAQIEAARKASDVQRATRVAKDKENAPRLAQNSMELFNMITSLGKPDGGLSCEQMDVLLLEEAKRRQKFYGPADTAPAPIPSGGGLRLVEPAPERPKAVNPLVRPK